MKEISVKVAQLEAQVESLEKTVAHIKPAVQQAANKTVVVWIAVVITVLNCIILLLNET